MRFLRYFLVVVTLCAAGSAFAEEGVPKIVSEGFEIYQKYDNKAAVATWLKNSPVGTDANNAKVADTLSQIETAYGRVLGFELIRVVNLTPSMRRVYVLIRYERGPAYASYDCYFVQGAWIISGLDFNTKMNEILPSNILGGN
ncbi:MAG TPA: hypothetical protein VG733_19790 [Chthoniobacteraceae bacterium]|nr:hypothetical protein [Chthoniobacteraceae bacterium]